MTCDTSVVTCDTILAHNISQYKSSHVKWPRSQVATCDTSSVTGSHLWHGSLNMWRFYTVIYWRGYFTVDCYSKFWTKRLSLGIKQYGRKENWSNNHSVSVPKRKVFNHHHPSMPWVSRWALPCAISALSSGQKNLQALIEGRHPVLYFITQI